MLRALPILLLAISLTGCSGGADGILSSAPELELRLVDGDHTESNSSAWIFDSSGRDAIKVLRNELGWGSVRLEIEYLFFPSPRVPAFTTELETYPGPTHGFVPLGRPFCVPPSSGYQMSASAILYDEGNPSRPPVRSSSVSTTAACEVTP